MCFKGILLDVVEPPVSPVVVESAGHKHPYVLLFVGGLPTSNYLGSLDPIYQSSVSNLLGCLRGLMLGAQILNMRDRSYWSHYPTESGSLFINISEIFKISRLQLDIFQTFSKILLL